MVARTRSVGRGSDLLRGVMMWLRHSGQDKSRSLQRFTSQGRPHDLASALASVLAFSGRSLASTRDKQHHVAELEATIAELERTKAELRQQSQMLADIASRSARARMRAQEQARVRARLVAQISHDLRTPLNAVIGFSDVMQRELFGPLGHERYRDYSCHIRESGHHLLKAAEDILALTRISSGTLLTEEDEFDLSDLLRESARYVASEAEHRGVTMERPERAGLMIQADRKALRQALINLLSEAISFSPVAGRIELRASLQDGVVAIHISGAGGAGTEASPAPCDAFLARERLEADTGTDGLGLDRPQDRPMSLGLAIGVNLVELLGGTLRISANPGRGLTAICLLPASNGASARDLAHMPGSPSVPMIANAA